MSITQDEVLNLDLVDAATPGKYPPIPEGEYVFRVADTSPEPAKSGKPMYTLQFEVAEGEYKGRKQWHRRSVQASTAGFVKADLQALGLKVPSGAINAADLARFVAREARGRLVRGVVGFGTGDYAERNEVKALLPFEAEAETIDAAALDTDI